ncbi:MAG: Ca2+-dependent phosphoinositide-specific phospholipase C [Clostridia bacterium]|nr:Ca2+-dependent phosphoinositide-specific phospholipase C [Clostridia bacterium]
MKRSKRALKITLIISCILTVLIGGLIGGVFWNMYACLDESFEAQASRMVALRSGYASPSFEPVDEQSFCDFDLAARLSDGTKYNRLQYIASHNSYKLPLSAFSEAAFDVFGAFAGMEKAQFEYNMPTITEQLNNGIRFMELDVNYMKRKGEWQIICCHNPILDNRSTAIDFGIALEEISLWSRANPGHLPLTVFVEPKSDFLFFNTQKEFGIEGLQEVGGMLNSAFGNNLYTPSDMLGEYDNFKQLTDADGWPEVKDMLGKVLFVLFPEYNLEYMNLDPSMRTQPMFMCVWYHSYEQNLGTFAVNTPYIMTNSPDTVYKGQNALQYFLDKNCFVRTRLDFYPEQSADTTLAGIASGAQLLTTDYPKGSDNKEGYYTAFKGGFTIKLRGE